MKKFFTLCLMFLVAGVLNLSAGYVLSGENVNGESWNHSSAKNTFTEDENGDLVLTGVSLSGEFLVTLDQKSWFKPVYSAQLTAGVPLVFTTDDSNGNCKAAASYTNCTIKLTKLSATAVAVEIVSTDTQDVELAQLGENWSLSGAFNSWSDLELTKKSYGVYEAWIDQATVNGLVGKEFKFKTGDWVADFGSTGLSYELNQWNILQRSGANITTFVQPSETYDKYLLTFCVEGSAAKFRIDGYKQATQAVAVFYESFDACNNTGGNDGLFSGTNTANGAFTPDNEGWVVASKNGGNKCGKFGSGSKSGELTSPALGLTGDATLTFKAAPWGTDGTSLGLSISSGQLSESSLTMTANQWTEYTVKITGATPDATLTFTPAKRFFLDEVKVVQGDASADMKAAEITLVGVMKDATSAYYHNTLQTPSVNVTLPQGASYMDIEVLYNNYPNTEYNNQTADYKFDLYNPGNYTINVTAYGNGVYSTTSKDIVIENVSTAWTFDELINKGEGATCYLNFSPTVVAHVGKYLYLEGYDMWDGIRSSALVYASLDKTYKKGDVLQGFIATVSYYNGNPQLIPLNTSLGDSYSYSEPYVYEVEAGEAWKAFAVEANVNKYVRVKNAPVTANPDAVDGVTAYTKHLGVNMPDDVNKKYDVEGFINNFNGTIQIKPISFTAIEEKIEPFTYTEIVPANNAEVTSLSEIKITFPYDVTYDAEVSVLVMDGENMITPTVAVEGNVATLTFDAITAYGSKPSLMVMAGAFKASGVGCEQIMAAWSIPTPPIVPGLTLAKATPANGSTVEKLERITLQISGDVYDCRYASQSYGNEFITVTDDKGNSYNGKIGYTSYTDIYYLYVENATAPGTYTITIKEGVFGDEEYLKKYAKGLTNPEIVLTYTIKGAALAAPTVDPANGAEVENLNTITLTFAEAVTANAEAGAITLVNNSNQNLDYAKNIAVAISEDGLTATITSEPSLGAWTAETYTMSIPAGYFVATTGAANEALSYNWKVVAPKFTYVAVDPAQGEVESLETIFIDFGGFRPRLIDGFTYPTYNLVNANGETVTTAATNYSYEQIDGSYYYKLKVTLGAKVTTPGDYFLTIPAGVFKDKDVYSGYNENAEMTFKWTVMEPDPNTYTLEYNVSPAEGVVTELTKIEFTPKAAGMIYMPIDEAQVANWVKVTDANGTVYNTTAKAGKGYEVSIEGVTEPGTYTVVIPKGSFYDFMASMSNPNSKNFNDEIVLTYTLEAAALAAPTVSPANGSEIESPSTITLTFAEAVTVNAEAGELTMVNTGDPNYDKAKNFNVTISEDGLTATITSEPGYLDRWATNATYKLNIPAGYFVGASGATSEALEYSWKVVPARFTYTAVTPAQGEVESLETIFVDFGGFRPRVIDGYTYPTYNLVNANGETVTTAATNYSYEQIDGSYYYKLKVTLGAKVTTPGDYFLTIPAGVFKDKDVYSGYNENAEMTFKWTVMEPDPNTYDLALTSDPANGATVTELKTIKISAADASVIAMPTTEAQSAGWFTIKDAEGNSYNYTANVGVGIEINIEGATAPGTYTVVVPAKSFVDATTMTAASKRYNAEMVLTYTLQEEEDVDNTVYDYAPVTVSPANGSEVESLEKIFVSFPYGVYDCLWAAKEYSKDFIQVSDENGNTYEAKIAYGPYTEDYYIYVKDATAPGKYTIVVPKGLVFDEEYSETFASGHANPEFTLTYTIVAPVVEDFTPVVNPTAGNVTAEQIKTTVLSFESPIASFDGSNVGLRHQFGGPWYDYAATGTISEDKLSMTIVWDFSPTVGTTYTLKLPAGCIVLENGAKNLETNVVYTVVAGPKDLAEFVVPAGINGYINYDETDVNAWAPEFPFTVSTTAYNTVAFAAELPSLPAGITAMEVIDENGEVIAILNQDGVAPLADGEIYYVKGETTKEYVDGAELKFRFRFTHLGVSETIQFSYIIAGGNITSIADVELDGNVIVRGNDIIAPQGAAIFTVSGIRVPAEGLAPGVYVVVLGNQAVKVMVK